MDSVRNRIKPQIKKNCRIDRKEDEVNPKLKFIMIFFYLSASVMMNAYANGFNILSQGAKAAAMANAFTARASDPSSVWYNPAGLANIEGFQIYTGGLLNLAEGKKYYSVYRNATLAADSTSILKPNIYLSYKLSDRIALGLGLNSPIGYEIEWPKTEEVEHVVFILNKLKINTTAISPAAALKLNDHLSLGAGINFYFHQFYMRYHYPYDTNVLVALLSNGQVLDVPDAVFDLSNFKTSSIGYYAGIQWKPTSGLSFGAVFRKGTPLTFDSGDVNAWEPPTPDDYVNAKLEELFIDSPQQKATISYSTTDQFQAGVAVKPMESLELEFDLTWIFWAKMDSIEIIYREKSMFRSFWHGYFDVGGETDFKNVVSLQLGGEYKLNPSLGFRFGAFHHGSPLVLPNLNPAFPLAANKGFTLGIGWQYSRFQVDLAYIYKSYSKLEAENSTLLRWGDPSQTYLSRKDNALLLSTGIRF